MSPSKHGAVHLDSDPGLQIAPFQTRRGRRLAHRASAAEERKRRRQPSHTSTSLVSSRQAEARRQAFQAESRSHGAKEPAKATARRFARSLPRPSSPDQRHRDRSPHDREFGRHGRGLAVWQPQNRGCPHGQPGNGRRDAQVQRPYAALSYKGPYSRPSPSCIQFGRPVGAWRITAIVRPILNQLSNSSRSPRPSIRSAHLAASRSALFPYSCIIKCAAR